MENKQLLLKILTELSPSAIKLYLFICILGGWENTKENIKLYCDTFGLSKCQYYAARKELVAKGYMSIEPKNLVLTE